MALNNFFIENFEEFKSIRRFLHSKPESGTETFETASFVKSKLDEFKISYNDIGENSVVAEIYGKNPGKTIAIRGDMDALEILENNDLPYKSKKEGLMHACGHDGHTTTLLAAAKYLSLNNDFNGRVLLLFQSGEEGFDGALKIIQDDFFKKYKIDLIYGAHNWPGFKAGKIVVHSGACMASEDRFYIKIKGQSGHASSPSGCIEPFAATADIIKACQTIVQRKIPTEERAVVSITKVHGGSADNIIPDSVDITGNVRATNPLIQDIIEKSIEEIAAGTAKTYGLKVELDYRRKHPVLVNSQIEPALNAALKTVGSENVITDSLSVMGSEDFALYLKHVKGGFVWIGNGTDSKLLHNSCYDFNDEIIPVGASFFVSLVHEILGCK